MGGFDNPEVRKKAMEESLKTRNRNRTSKFATLVEGEKDSDENLPVAVGEKDVESLRDVYPGFMPSISQLQILAIALSLDHGDSIRGWFKAAGQNRNEWYYWLKNPEFIAWWNKAFIKGIEQYRSEWLAIGLRRMNSNDPDRFNYWKNVGEKIFGFVAELKLKTDKSPEEEELTKELLELVKDVNKERNMKQIDGQVIDVVQLSKDVEGVDEVNETKK